MWWLVRAQLISPPVLPLLTVSYSGVDIVVSTYCTITVIAPCYSSYFLHRPTTSYAQLLEKIRGQPVTSFPKSQLEVGHLLSLPPHTHCNWTLTLTNSLNYIYISMSKIHYFTHWHMYIALAAYLRFAVANGERSSCWRCVRGR